MTFDTVAPCEIIAVGYSSADATVTVTFALPADYDGDYGLTLDWGNDEQSFHGSVSPGSGEQTYHFAFLPAPSGSCTVSLYTIAENGDPGVATVVAVVTASTTVTQVTGDSAALTIGWAAVAGYSGYEAYLVAPGGAVRTVASATTTALFAGPFEPGSYTGYVVVTAASGISSGPPSPNCAIVLGEIIAVAYSSANATVAVTFALPADYDGDYGLTLDWNGDEQSVHGSVSPGSGEEVYRFSSLPAASGACSVSLYTVAENGDPGLAIMVAVVAASTTITQFAGDFAALTVSWAAVAGYNAYEARLVAPGGAVQALASDSTAATFAGPFEPGSYTTYVVVTADGGISTGPQSPECSFALAAAPTVTLIEYDGATSLSVAWSAPEAYAGSYAVTLEIVGVDPNAVTITDQTSVVLTVEPLVGTGNMVWVETYQEPAGVPIPGPSSPRYELLTAAPGWISLDYDAQVLAPSWTAEASGSATGYAIAVGGLAGSPFAVGDVTTASIPALLAPGGRYPTSIRATGAGGIVLGPATPDLLPLTGAPQSPWLGYNGTALILSWSPGPDASATGYLAQLTAGGTVVTADPAASPHSFAATFASDTLYSAIVRETGAQTLGPWSATAIGPYQTSVSYTADTQGRLSAEAWTAATITYAMDAAGNIDAVTPTPAPTPTPVEAEA